MPGSSGSISSTRSTCPQSSEFPAYLPNTSSLFIFFVRESLLTSLQNRLTISFCPSCACFLNSSRRSGSAIPAHTRLLHTVPYHSQHTHYSDTIVINQTRVLRQSFQHRFQCESLYNSVTFAVTTKHTFHLHFRKVTQKMGGRGVKSHRAVLVKKNVNIRHICTFHSLDQICYLHLAHFIIFLHSECSDESSCFHSSNLCPSIGFNVRNTKRSGIVSICSKEPIYFCSCLHGNPTETISPPPSDFNLLFIAFKGLICVQTA